MPSFSKTINASLELLIKFILLLIIISVFVPFSPKMPASDIDSSWAISLNQAVIQGLSFGKEIIFTLGPYASIYTKVYHPVIDSLMIGGCVYLALSYWLGLVLLMKGFRGYCALAFCVLFLGMIYARDSLFFSYPLLVGLICCKTIALEHKAGVTNNQFPLLAILLFAPFGLLSLIKGSALILSVTVALLCSIFFIINNRKALAAIALFAPAISMSLFWCAIGQSITNLPFYFIQMILISAGFTEAMSKAGNVNEIILYLANAALFLWAIAWQKKIIGTAKIFLLCLFFVFLFISFKAGFTRHYGHAFIPGTSILIAALFLPFIFNSKVIAHLGQSPTACPRDPSMLRDSWIRRTSRGTLDVDFIITVAIIICSFNTWYYINNHYTRISFYTNSLSTYSSTWHGFKSRITDKNGLKQDYNLSMNVISKQASFPILKGTTDIYSYQQAYLISSKNNWQPRPIFQSYSVFTPLLAEKNKRHLLGQQGPDNIIFKIEPIDERIPSLEDGASWPFILAYYQPVSLQNNFLFLQKRNIFNKITPSMEVLSSEHHMLDEEVTLPDLNDSLFAEVEIKPTIAGYFTNIFFKPSQLHITLTLKDGTKKQYRIIASMAKSGFLISPLIENTTEFTLLYSKKNYLNEKMVRSFVITTNKNKNWQWSNEYLIRLKALPLS